MPIRRIAPSHSGDGLRVGIVLSRFNAAIGEGLLAGALRALREGGVADADITVVSVPGALESPLALQQLAQTDDYDALIAQLQKEGDPARRAQLSMQAQDMLLNDVVDIPIASRKIVSAYAKTLRGVDLNPWDSELWNVAGWYN